MKVLIACEESGVVRRAFRARGHDAWSCDLQPARDGSEHHLQCDVLTVLDRGWDLMIGHPECTYIALCQIWRKYKPGKEWRKVEEDKAIEFFRKLWEAPIPRICLENPMSVASSRVAKKSQAIHPWQFGHGEKKETWLWLKNLPPLKPTNIVEGRKPRVHHMTPGPNRKRDRSETYQGIAEAMADQWGILPSQCSPTNPVVAPMNRKRKRKLQGDQIDFGHLLIPREMDDMVIDAALHHVENQAVIHALLEGRSWNAAFGIGGGTHPVMWRGDSSGIEVHAPDGTRVIKPAQILERAEKYREKPPF